MPSAHLSPDRRGTGTIEEIVAILRNEGLIDEATQQKLLVKHASEREKKHTNGVLEGLEWSGDLRVRHEAFWFRWRRDGRPRAGQPLPPRSLSCFSKPICAR